MPRRVIEPEMREDTGEVEAAAKHQLPTLLQVKDIHGVFHNHTTASDGSATLEEMAKAANSHDQTLTCSCAVKCGSTTKG